MLTQVYEGEQTRTLDDYLLGKSEFDVNVVTALITMYVQYGVVNIARVVFDKMPNGDKLSWLAMISGYETCLMPQKAIEIFKIMKAQNIMPDEITIASVLSAYSCLCNLDMVIVREPVSS